MGIDYGNGKTNIDTKTGIRFGVIPQHEVGEAWYEGSEGEYGKPCCPHCDNELDETEEFQLDDKDPVMDKNDNEVGDEYYCTSCDLGVDGYNPDIYPEEPLCQYVDDSDLKAHCTETDIWIEKSPYYTWCDFCSPCAPGAGYLTSSRAIEDSKNDCKAYCFGHEWFEGDKAPYKVFSVETDKEVLPD